VLGHAIRAHAPPAALVVGQPARVRRTVGEVEECDHGENDRRERLDDEEPLPAPQAARAVEAEQRRRHGRAQRRGKRNGGHEIADDPRPVGGGEPQREEKDDAGKEPGLREAEQDPQEIERIFGAQSGPKRDVRNEGHRARDDSPGEHDARDPDPRPNLVQDDVGRHLEQEIGGEEHARAEAESGFGEPEVRVHRQLGEADIDPVEIGDEVAEDEERNEAPCDLRNCPRLDIVRHVSLPVLRRVFSPASASIERRFGRGAVGRPEALSQARPNNSICRCSIVIIGAEIERGNSRERRKQRRSLYATRTRRPRTDPSPA